MNEPKPQKKSKRKVIILSVVTVLVVTAIGTATYWGTRSPEDRARWITEHVSDEFALDANQSALVEDMGNVVVAARTQFKGSKSAQLEELRKLVDSENFDRAAAQELWLNNRSIVDNTVRELINQFAALHATLSGEQKRQMSARIQKHLQRRH